MPNNPSERLCEHFATRDMARDAVWGAARGAVVALRLVPAVTCASCGQPPGDFRDALSEREFTITGLCQVCQDEVFAEPEHGPDDEVCPHCGSVVCYVADSRDGFVLRCGNTGKAVGT